MKPPSDPNYRHRFPAEVISHGVWLNHVFSLSLRDVELLMAERSVIVSYKTLRRWCRKFRQSFACALRHRQPRPGDKWHFDEVFIRILGGSLGRKASERGWGNLHCRSTRTRPA